MKNIFYFTAVIACFIAATTSNNARAQAPTTTCATASVLTINGACGSGLANNATEENPLAASATCLGGSGTCSREAWHRFTVPAGQVWDISISASITQDNRDLMVQLCSGTCGSLTEIACANDFQYDDIQTENINNVILTAGTYYIKLTNVGTSGNLNPVSTCVTGCRIMVPGLATYTAPANAATGQQNCGINLTWNAPTNSGCNEATSYDVYFGTSATPPLVTNTTSTTYNTGALAVSTTYYWKIVPKNAAGSAAAPVTWSFTTAATPSVPAVASYLSPANAATGQNLCGMLLTWSPPTITGCNAATSYDVYFGTSATPPMVTNTTGTSYYTGALTGSTTYYWKIVPRNALGVTTGVSTWSFTTSAGPCVSCIHTIRLTDSYGDGWNGGTVTVTVNGVAVLTNITMATSTVGPEDFTFSAADGDVINITRTADGSYPAEMEVAILGPGSFTILPTQNPVVAPGTSVTGCCTPVSPSCASSPVPANNATNIDACGLTLSWTAPAGSSCSNPTSYDVYFGTSASPGYYANVTTTNYTVPSGLADNTTYYWKIVPRNTAGAASSCTVWYFTTGTSTTQYFCLTGDAVGLPAAGTNCVQMTDAVTDGFGCSWNRTMVSFSNPIDYSVNMYFGNDPTGGDGCAFVFQNSPEGTTACGTNGRELGAGGISNSLIIEFDTYDNDNPAHIIDMAPDHTAVEIDSDLSNGAPFCGPVQADPLDALLDDGTVYALRITWDPVTQNLSIYVSGSLRLTCNYDFITNVFGGNPNVYWGFTASTGANSNQQYYCPVSMSLPVEIFSLSSYCENNKPSIQWVTATETNNDYFTIERSFDGVEYELAGIVDGAGNANSRREYMFQDNEAYSGDCYYRLSQTDFDGANHLIDILKSNCVVEPELSIINISSSGHNTATDVEFTTQISGKHQIEVIDVQGKRVYSDTFEAEKGCQHYIIPAEVNLPKVYFLKIYSGSVSTSKKVAKP